jgi:hypothetical protein
MLFADDARGDILKLDILQLQRLAVEAKHVGSWNGLAGAVPVPVDAQHTWSAGVTEPVRRLLAVRARIGRRDIRQ